VQVGPFRYKLITFIEPGLYHGSVRDMPNREIEVYVGSDKDTVWWGLLHELIHAVDDLFQIGLKEKQVKQLGSALLMVLKENNLLNERGLDFFYDPANLSVMHPAPGYTSVCPELLSESEEACSCPGGGSTGETGG